MISGPRGLSRNLLRRIVLIAAACSALASCGDRSVTKRQPAAVPEPPAEFVGSARCGSCHAKEQVLWKGSHHDLAMQVATRATVLGNFNDAQFRYGGVTSRFFMQGDAFMVRTDAADGALKDFRIQYTFGVYPLQQYLIETTPGQFQALSIFWDARPGTEGGQRWAHLYPDEKVAAGDPLHWTGRMQNWNTMCAACHSTDLRKNYDLETNRFATTWKDINVACEACHGPASNHLRWAASSAARDLDRAGGAAPAEDADADVALGARSTTTAQDAHAAQSAGVAQAAGAGHTSSPNRGFVTRLGRESAGSEAWRFVTKDAPIAALTGAPRSADRMEVCFPCHSRRSQLTEPAAQGSGAFLDAYSPALLDAGLYHKDGQILDEVYEYGSFQQSLMHQRGVICSDCHDPHSLKLRHEGNGVCAQCHQPAVFDTQAHHHHPSDEPALLCADCHMPKKRFMVVDMRRDHSIRVPRPDLSVTHGTPNACDQCHADKGVKWQADAVNHWLGKPSRPLPPLLAISTNAREASDSVRDTGLPAIVRATLVSHLADHSDTAVVDVLESSLKDTDALVRAAAAKSLSELPGEARAPLIAPLLQDPTRLVRIEAARALADVPDSALTTAQQSSRHAAERELLASELANAERPEAHLNLASYYGRQGDFTKAESSLRTALRLDPSFIPAYINLADVLRAAGRDADAETLLGEAMKRSPQSGAVAHAVGLLKARAGDMTSALELLAKATRLSPEDARFGYVYAMGLQSAQRPDAALRELERVHRKVPDDTNVLFALATINRDLGKRAEAQRWVSKLLALDPQNEDAQALRQSL